MSDVVFINPPRSRRGVDHVLDTAMLWLASSLRQAGVEASVRMPSGATLDDDIATILQDERPRYVAVACKWWNTLYGGLQVAEAVRRAAPDVKIVFGGHTASVFPRELIATGKVDVVLLGDADFSIHALVREGRVSNGYSAAGYHPALPAAADVPSLDNVTLGPLDSIVDRPELVPGYVWIGRGCSFGCFYCLETHTLGKQFLGRAAPRLRSPESVARDIAALAGRTELILDWEHPATHYTEPFMEAIADACADRMSSCYYFDWSLPSPRLLDVLSSRFSHVSICLDIQAFHQPHRRELATRRMIKPFFSDDDLLRTLALIERKGNVDVDATGLVGMPFEDADARKSALAFIECVTRSYSCVRDWRVSPLHVIPGTLLTQASRFHNLEVSRRTFADFLAVSAESFEEATPYYENERSVHPHGVHPVGQPREIIDFMRDANGRLEDLRRARRNNQIWCDSDGVRVRIEDPFSPLPALLDTLDAAATRHTGAPLHVGLGDRTRFGGSWLDYTSESGENSATRSHLGSRSSDLSARLRQSFDCFADVRLDAPDDIRWGVVAAEWTRWRGGRVDSSHGTGTFALTS